MERRDKKPSTDITLRGNLFFRFQFRKRRRIHFCSPFLHPLFRPAFPHYPFPSNLASVRLRRNPSRALICFCYFWKFPQLRLPYRLYPLYSRELRTHFNIEIFEQQPSPHLHEYLSLRHISIQRSRSLSRAICIPFGVLAWFQMRIIITYA